MTESSSVVHELRSRLEQRVQDLQVLGRVLYHVQLTLSQSGRFSSYP